MGSGCLSKTSVDSMHPKKQEDFKSKAIPIKEDLLKVKKGIIFHTEGSESSFLDLSSPRSGKAIKWRMGELIGEGAFAKVFQCINQKTGELMAVKHFLVYTI